MARNDVNRFAELEVFVKVVEQGGFSAAARQMGMTPSAVSKLISRLEQRLATRLVNRSTRQLQVTSEGCDFYERGRLILANLEEAERATSAQATPKGRIHVNTNVPFAEHFLLPLVPAFGQRYPDISLELSLTDQVIDIVEQRADVALRAGPLKSSSLVARKLGQTHKLLVAAPGYLKQHPTPLHPDDLAQHTLIDHTSYGAQSQWPFREQGKSQSVTTRARWQANNGQAVKQLVMNGAGIARLAVFQVKNEIAKGELVPLLETYNPKETEEIHAVYVGQGGFLPRRVRVFLDFLVEHVVIDGVL